MKKFILIGLVDDDRCLHTERDFTDCSLSELSLLLAGLKTMEKQLMEKIENDYEPVYLFTDDEVKDNEKEKGDEDEK